MKIQIKNKSKGFGIVEVLIASVIIVMVIFALTAAGRNSLFSTEYMSQQAQATYLAQEGIETVRQIRDTKWLDGQNGNNNANWDYWDCDTSVSTPVFGAVVPGNYYKINDDGTTNSIDQTINNPDQYHKLMSLTDKNVNYADESTWNNITLDGTNFSRIIYIDNPVSYGLLPFVSGSTSLATARRVTVIVKWTGQNQKVGDVEMSEILTNWRPSY